MRYRVFLMLLASHFLVQGQDISYDEKIGAEGELMVERQMGIYDDSVKAGFVNEIGFRLVDQLGPQPFDYTFKIVDMAEPNAFALPAGHIYVTRGILALANTEDELAGVLSHEIIHSHRRHTVRQMKKSILPGLLQIPGAIVSSVAPDLGRVFDPLTMGSQAIIASHSRGHEKEADQYGIKIAGEAGYDPFQLATILKNLSQQAESMTGQEEKKNWLSDHPYTPKRIDYIYKNAEKIEVSGKKNIYKTRFDFLKQIDGLVYGDNPAQGVFNGPEFLHPDLDLFFLFPEKWRQMNTPTVVAAVDSTNSALIYLTLEHKYESARMAADSIAYLYEMKTGNHVDDQKELFVNGLNANLISVIDRSGQKPMYIFLMWVEFNDLLIKITGAGYEKYKSRLQKSAESIRKLNAEEKKSIKKHVLRIRKARANESLEDFNKRTGNEWDLSQTAIINGIDPSEKLQEGQILKISKLEPYQTK